MYIFLIFIFKITAHFLILLQNFNHPDFQVIQLKLTPTNLHHPTHKKNRIKPIFSFLFNSRTNQAIQLSGEIHYSSWNPFSGGGSCCGVLRNKNSVAPACSIATASNLRIVAGMITQGQESLFLRTSFAEFSFFLVAFATFGFLFVASTNCTV